MPNMRIGLFGAGGFGREVFPLLGGMDRHLLAEEKYAEPDTLTLAQFLDLEPTHFNVAISDSKVRERISEQCIEAGLSPYAIISPRAYIAPGSLVQEGAIILPFAVISTPAQVGRFLHMNYYACIGHGCMMGNFVTLGPQSILLGNARVDDHANIGTAAVIMPGVRIGEHAIVGAGAVVTKDVAPGQKVIGMPARAM